MSRSLLIFDELQRVLTKASQHESNIQYWGIVLEELLADEYLDISELKRKERYVRRMIRRNTRAARKYNKKADKLIGKYRLVR